MGIRSHGGAEGWRDERWSDFSTRPDKSPANHHKYEHLKAATCGWRRKNVTGVAV